MESLDCRACRKEVGRATLCSTQRNGVGYLSTHTCTHTHTHTHTVLLGDERDEK